MIAVLHRPDGEGKEELGQGIREDEQEDVEVGGWREAERGL